MKTSVDKLEERIRDLETRQSLIYNPDRQRELDRLKIELCRALGIERPELAFADVKLFPYVPPTKRSAAEYAVYLADQKIF